METNLNTTTQPNAGEPQPTAGSEKLMLAEEIERLRTVLVESRTTATKTKNELKAFRQQLKDRQRELRQECIIASVLPKLKRKLKTPDAVYAFLQSVAADFSLVHRPQDGGILVMDPGARTDVVQSDPAAPMDSAQAAAASQDSSGDAA